MVARSLTNYMVVILVPGAVISTLDIATVSSKQFLNIQANIECGFSLKHVRDKRITYSQMNRKDKYSEFSSIIWSVWPNT